MAWLEGWQRTYCGAAPGAAAWLGRWNLDPALLVVLAACVLAAVRLGGSRRTAGLAACGVAVVAFVSPLCALASALFTARAVHHLVTVALLAPLLAIAWPARRAVALPVALAAMVVPLWLWHGPAVYAAALGHVAIYWLLQGALIGGSWLFWATVLRAPAPVAVPAAIAASAQAGLLGALLTFAPRPLYAAHLTTTVGYGLGPLADQQLAGLVMWVPGMAPFAAVAALGAARAWRSPTTATPA